MNHAIYQLKAAFPIYSYFKLKTMLKKKDKSTKINSV